MADYAGWRISTGILTGNVLVDPDPGVDEDASISRLAEQMREAIEAVFPGADVEIPVENASGVIPWDCKTHVYPDTDLDISQVEALEDRVQEIVDGVWERQEWYVESAPATGSN